MPPTADDFRAKIQELLDCAISKSEQFIDINAGKLHTEVGGYPGPDHRLSTCCHAMAQFYDEDNGDEYIESTPSRKGAKVTIRYRLPRKNPPTIHQQTQQESDLKSISHTKKRSPDPEAKTIDLISHFKQALEAFYADDVFIGPCLYFHKKTINIRRGHGDAVAAIRDDSFIEALYATLTAWGMHKLGKGGPKLCDFNIMKESLLSNVEEIDELQKYRLDRLSSKEVEQITIRCWQLINKIDICQNLTKLVAGSKALHHILPDLMPPIDRTYTLMFFYGKTQFQTKKEEYKFSEIFPLLYKISIDCKSFISSDVANNQHEMATSTTKVIDNAIVGYVRNKSTWNSPRPGSKI
jgi:hypothetical protein